MFTKKTYCFSGNIPLFGRVLFVWIFACSIRLVAQTSIIGSENITQFGEGLVFIADSGSDSKDDEKKKPGEHEIQNISSAQIYIIGETSLVGGDEIFNSDIAYVVPLSSSEKPSLKIAGKQKRQKKEVLPAISQESKENLFTLRSREQSENHFEIIAKTAKVSLPTQHKEGTIFFPGCISFFERILERHFSLFYNKEYSFAEKFFISDRAPPFPV